MVLSVLWPGSIFYYPIGNTSAVDLTDTLAPEEPAHVLALGCGDPRHILFTVHNQSPNSKRVLDFTCCDVEPAILARNALLFTMIAANNRPSPRIADRMWNIFFHFFLDEESTALLEAQCQRLLDASTSLDAWNESAYSSFLRFCNEHTRLELRRHWKLYIDTGKLPPAGKQEIKETLLSGMKKVRSGHPTAPAGARSAGPFISESLLVTADVYSRFWRTGTTFVSDKAASSTKNINPTFVYTTVGTDFSVHFGTTPLAPFHLAPAFLRPDPASVTESDLVDCAKSQFRHWVVSFQTYLQKQPGRTVVRLFCGEALSLCYALAEHRLTGSVSREQTVAPWNTTPLIFDSPDYAPGNPTAPLIFNVVETSNLTDYVGYLNVLIATIPLLSEAHSATLFTETLLYVSDDPTKNFNRQLCADISTISVFFNLLPTSYPSNFSSRSYATELILHNWLRGRVPQYHERLAWRRPTTSDPLASSLNVSTLRPVAFEPSDLAKLLLGIYFSMFSSDDAAAVLTGAKSVTELSLTHYVRETFVALVATIKRVVTVDWKATVEMFLTLLGNTRSSFTPGDSAYRHELCAQFHLAGIHTPSTIGVGVPKRGRFEGWHRVPPTVSVTLVVPRARIQVLLDMDKDELENPILQATLQGQSAYLSFSSIKVGFGKVANSGTVSEPRITFDADPAGLAGSSPLVVSFSLPSWTLNMEDPQRMMVALSLRSLPQTVRLMKKFGMFLHVFKARLMDTSVFVVPEEPHGVCHRLCNMATQAGGSDGWKVFAGMDVEGKRVSTFTARDYILDDPPRSDLSSNAYIPHTQISPCILEVSIGSERRRLVYPSPVDGTRSRIVQESGHIEVIAPLAGERGLSMNLFPVSVTEKIEPPWNLHRLNLDALPVVDISESLEKIHVELVWAATNREKSMRDAKDRTDTLLNVKDTIHTMFTNFSGSRRARVFPLHVNHCFDTIVFVSAVRLDLASYGFVMDAHVLTLSEQMVDKVRETLGAIDKERRLIAMLDGEPVAWKQLLPAFAERCRTWKHGRNCEYLARKMIPLSLEYYGDPLCSCGKGKNLTSEFTKEERWKSAVPFVTRIAIGPLYGVPFVENVGGSMAKERCRKCGGPGKPKLLVCSACKGAEYCSSDCQRADWKVHKKVCRK